MHLGLNNLVNKIKKKRSFLVINTIAGHVLVGV